VTAFLLRYRRLPGVLLFMLVLPIAVYCVFFDYLITAAHQALVR
jgi:hypothetical protein